MEISNRKLQKPCDSGSPEPMPILLSRCFGIRSSSNELGVDYKNCGDVASLSNSDVSRDQGSFPPDFLVVGGFTLLVSNSGEEAII